jgi:hypothetical protein
MCDCQKVELHGRLATLMMHGLCELLGMTVDVTMSCTVQVILYVINTFTLILLCQAFGIPL